MTRRIFRPINESKIFRKIREKIAKPNVKDIDYAVIAKITLTIYDQDKKPVASMYKEYHPDCMSDETEFYRKVLDKVKYIDFKILQSGFTAKMTLDVYDQCNQRVLAISREFPPDNKSEEESQQT